MVWNTWQFFTVFFVVFICDTIQINHLKCIIIAALKKAESHSDVVEYFRDLPFYNKRIKKPKIKRLKKLICFVKFLLMKN